MKVAIPFRPSSITAQFAYALAFALVIVTLVLASGILFASASSPAPIVRPSIPAITPADYRLPGEPVDYSDPNYIGSYGG